MFSFFLLFQIHSWAGMRVQLAVLLVVDEHFDLCPGGGFEVRFELALMNCGGLPASPRRLRERRGINFASMAVRESLRVPSFPSWQEHFERPFPQANLRREQHPETFLVRVLFEEECLIRAQGDVFVLGVQFGGVGKRLRFGLRRLNRRHQSGREQNGRQRTDRELHRGILAAHARF